MREIDNFGYWTVVFPASQQHEFVETLRNVDERERLSFEIKGVDSVPYKDASLSIAGFRCTDEVMRRICEELKNNGVELL